MVTQSTSNRGGMASLLSTVDHKTIGRMYIFSSILVLLTSLVGAAVSAYEALDPSSLQVAQNVDQSIQVWSMSREGIIFGGILPLLIGIGVYIVPLQLGILQVARARDLLASFWTWALGIILMISSYIMNGGPAGGRKDYIILWALSLGLVFVGLVWSSLVLLTNIIVGRAQGMGMARMPLTSWSYFVFSIITVLGLPVALFALALTYIQVKYGQIEVENSIRLLSVVSPWIRPTLVFLFVVPLFGFGLDILEVNTGLIVKRKPAMFAIGIFATSVLVGMVSYLTQGLYSDVYIFNIVILSGMILASFCLAAMNFRVTLSKKSESNSLFNNPAIFSYFISLILAFGAIVLSLIDEISLGYPSTNIVSFTVGGIEKNDISLVPLEGIVAYGPVFVLCLGAAICSCIAALFHWSVKFWGVELKKNLTMISIIGLFLGTLLWSVGQILTSVRYSSEMLVDSSLDRSDDIYGELILFGSLLVVLSLFILVINLASTSFSKSNVEPSWHGRTLEWATSSPPISSNFLEQPIVNSVTPLNDNLESKKLLDHPSTETEVENG